MKQVGSTLFFFGAGSIVLYFLNMQFIILEWIDHWGSTVGWGIRIGMAVIGLSVVISRPADVAGPH
jgi:hypothetical protein